MSRAAPIADWKTQALARADQLWATHGQSRWQGLNARERLLVSVFLGLFGVWLFVSIAISPALRTLNASESQRAEVAQQVLQMRDLQQRAQGLPLDEAQANSARTALKTKHLQLRQEGNDVWVIQPEAAP